MHFIYKLFAVFSVLIMLMVLPCAVHAEQAVTSVSTSEQETVTTEAVRDQNLLPPSERDYKRDFPVWAIVAIIAAIALICLITVIILANRK